MLFSQLFFVDSGTADTVIRYEEPSADVDSTSPDVDVYGLGKPAWEDSDDERLTVSLRDNARLRKLRNTEMEDVITGTEYAKRLRRQ